jgi:hypothetical protein
LKNKYKIINTCLKKKIIVPLVERKEKNQLKELNQEISTDTPTYLVPDDIIELWVVKSVKKVESNEKIEGSKNWESSSLPLIKN